MDAVCGLAKLWGLHWKDAVWMGTYAALKPVYTFQHFWHVSFPDVQAIHSIRMNAPAYHQRCDAGFWTEHGKQVGWFFSLLVQRGQCNCTALTCTVNCVLDVFLSPNRDYHDKIMLVLNPVPPEDPKNHRLPVLIFRPCLLYADISPHFRIFWWYDVL